jgi:antigen flippase
MRRIADLAKMGVLGSLFGTIINIPLVYFLGVQGVALSLVGVAAMTILTSWWYSRKVQIQTTALKMFEVGREAAALLKLGFAFMASALMMTGTAYVVRLILLREVSVDAAGLYQSAWTLGGLYVGFILQAMGADFYPRLTGVVSDNAACNRMVNEKVQISLLLAGPGVLATLVFSPLVIALFYSAEFNEAVGILRWICLGGNTCDIWPIGFIILAKGAQKIFSGSNSLGLSSISVSRGYM